MYSGSRRLPARWPRKREVRAPACSLQGAPRPRGVDEALMRSFAVSQSRDDVYVIEFPPKTRLALAALSQRAREPILRRLAEIAHVASTLRTWMSDADEVPSILYFELSGYAVSYLVSDARRSL